MQAGDWIKQDRGILYGRAVGDDVTYGLLVEKQKNGGFKAVTFNTGYKKAAVQSTAHWYPSPVVINATEVPDDIIRKISGKMFKMKGRV